MSKLTHRDPNRAALLPRTPSYNNIPLPNPGATTIPNYGWLYGSYDQQLLFSSSSSSSFSNHRTAVELESQNDKAIEENTGLENQFSGTLGAAVLGSRWGVAAITISADDENRHCYQSGDDEKSSEIFVNVTMGVIEELLKVEKTEGPNYLPSGCVLNIKLQRAGPHYHFVLTTIFGSRHQCGIDHCGSHFLPDEQAVLDSQNCCWAAIPLIQSHSDPGAMSLLVRNSCGGLLNNEIVEVVVDWFKCMVVVQ
ncbi:uncharacterized protein PGTG_05672 [Puccinia graminis f. sp. tritici CRL 75-36-700-3]|uniref:Survival protein SurE-like phosphatase/nucleotidase domain-containing protein n=1 Tax=Puccinia graminis f. sp. tritici (strain CRL 75-36-700-3 / race SCCL) TaxID=418459 RepID=E3K536_PUCGT|nr:uncharacterized protein PGTG_05672 [Puccinia graminis f. sp. tritici CRL 75-36-700-3]EFP79351.2 hypothetical protein PGTG_05672 [Puccinia graminis f. sp. tritici CRL 75-36-700-3]